MWNKVNQRLGRIQQKYPSIHRCYNVILTSDNHLTSPKVTSLSWEQKPDSELNQRSGIYFLHTSLDVASQELLWTSYNTIREVESSFRTLKTDLDLRPIYHKKDNSSMAHLHLGLLAYWVVNTLRYQLKQKGIKYQWREVVRIMNTQKSVTTTAQNDKDQIIVIRQCSEPTDKVRQIYQALAYKHTPYTNPNSERRKLLYSKKNPKLAAMWVKGRLTIIIIKGGVSKLPLATWIRIARRECGCTPLPRRRTPTSLLYCYSTF